MNDPVAEWLALTARRHVKPDPVFSARVLAEVRARGL